MSDAVIVRKEVSELEVTQLGNLVYATRVQFVPEFIDLAFMSTKLFVCRVGHVPRSVEIRRMSGDIFQATSSIASFKSM